MIMCGTKATKNTDKPEVNPRTVTGKLLTVWQSHPEKEVMIFYDDDDARTSLTNEEVRTLSEHAASLMHSHGVKKGDVVLNTLPNSMEKEITSFGIILAGAVVMDGAGIDDRGHHFWTPLLQANVKYIVVDPSPQSHAWSMLEHDIGHTDANVERWTSLDFPTLQKVFKFRLEHNLKNEDRTQVKSAFDVIRAHMGTFIERVSSHEPAAILVAKCPVEKHYKLVLKTHSDMCQMALRIEDMLGCTCDDVIYDDYSLAWLPGLPYCYFINGCTMVMSTLLDFPPQQVVRETWSLIETEKCTMASLVPPLIQMLSSHCEDLEEPHWCLRVLTTSNLVRQSVMDAIGPCTETLIICYSLIEGGLISRLVVTAETAAVYREGCVGDVSDQVRTNYQNENVLVKATKIGEIMLQGKLVSQEYYNDPHLTKDSYTKEGFLLSGDLGFCDENKQLFVLGRKSDAIIRGQTAIFPREIEEKVNQCPGIWKVKVVSIKDHKGSIQMCACVVPRSDDAITIDRVKEFCRYQLGGTFDGDDNPHMPTYVFFFDEFPMAQGVVNRRMLGYMASEIVHADANPAK